MGGLGNQMFQYALGRTLTYSSGLDLILNISWFNSCKERTYQLSQFNIPVITSPEAIDEDITSTKSLFTIMKRINKRIKKKSNYQKIYEESIPFNADILSSPDNSVLIGYWQSEKFFVNIEAVIRKDFRFIYPPVGENYRIIPEIKGKQSVAIHIRRGDYVANPSTYSTHGVCSLDYYNKGMQYIESHIGKPHYFIFTDDPEWARQNITSKYDITIIDWNNDAPYEDLRLISLCNHHIIANSSFSWWGAWLGKKEGQIVIAPDPWFDDPFHKTPDIYVRDWVCIQK